MYNKVEKLKLLRKIMEGGISEEYIACREAGVTQKQLEVWSKADDRIYRYRKALKQRCNGKRNDMVVDSLLKQALSGNVGAIAIWLKFKMGWKDSFVNNQIFNKVSADASDNAGKEKQSELLEKLRERFSV